MGRRADDADDGEQDWRVSLGEARAFDAALTAAHVEHRLVVYEHDEHQLVFHRPEWLQAAVDWFRAHGAFDQ